jgi:hypothetical protein
MQCPKCKTEAADAARFCRRCHATLRFQCPACHHEQRQGGTCEKCGVDFLKYLTAIVASRRAEADAAHEKSEGRSALLKNLVLLPFNMGIPLIRSLLLGRKSRGD